MTSRQSLTFLVSNEFTDAELDRMDSVSLQRNKSKKKTREWERKRARRERLRVNVLNRVMNSLFESIPDYFRSYYMWKKGKEGASVSKKDILLIAMGYIKFLNDILRDHGMTGSSLMNSE